MPGFNPNTAKTISYTVEGWGEFPHDMLRRDDARAASPEDKMRIDAQPGDYDPRAKVRIRLISGDPRSAPLVGRWESFGWKVVECEGQWKLSQAAESQQGKTVSPWSADEAMRELWKGLDKNGTNGAAMAHFRQHLLAAYERGRKDEQDGRDPLFP